MCWYAGRRCTFKYTSYTIGREGEIHILSLRTIFLELTVLFINFKSMTIIGSALG